MPPHLEHRHRRYGAECQQYAPGNVLRQSRPDERRRKDRADDQAGRLHREYQGHHHAAGALSGILGHNRRAHGVVAADADAEHGAKENQPPDARRQCRGHGADRQHQHLVAIDALAPEHIGDAAEQHRAERRCEQCRRCDKTLGHRRYLPFMLEHLHHDTDDEEIVGIGEEAHPGNEHDLPMQAREARLVHARQQIGLQDLPGS
jgi:hypothetical protein